MILLDTNVLVHYLKGVPEIVRQLEAAPRDQVAIPAITVYELEYGTLKAKFPAQRKRQLEVGLAHLQTVPFDHSAARAAARVRVDLEAAGWTIGPMDLLIAGIALSRGAVLITGNVAEFSRVQGLGILNWENPPL